MKDYRFPTEAGEVFAAVIGRRIISVKRMVLVSDYEVLSPEIRDEESDGWIELTFEDNYTIHFIPHTEHMSVSVKEGKMPRRARYSRPINPTENAYWAKRVGLKVRNVDILVSNHAAPSNRSEFGIDMALDGGPHVILEYVCDEEVPDALRICRTEPSGSYHRVNAVPIDPALDPSGVHSAS